PHFRIAYDKRRNNFNTTRSLFELSLNHSVIVGRVLLPGHEETGFNRNVTFRTEQYKEAPRRIKIISSLVVGDTEVRKV
ncbi:LiaF domain-containing protein, partial [Bacillus sp. D-CC]